MTVRYAAAALALAVAIAPSVAFANWPGAPHGGSSSGGGSTSGGTAVPEPASIAVMGAGLALLAARRRPAKQG